MKEQMLRVLRPAKRFAIRVLDPNGLFKAKSKLRKIAKLKSEVAPKFEIRLDTEGRLFLHEPRENLDFLFPLETDQGIKVGNFTGFEERERALAKAALRDQSAMIDIGANVGLFSLSAARSRDSVSVYAIEPVRDNFAVLNKNVARNNLTAQIFSYQLALGETRAEVEIPTGVGTWQFISSATDRKHSEGMPVQKVSQLPLDEFVREQVTKPISMIKCDVEGYELPVLKGAVETLRKHKPALLLEIVDRLCARFHYKPREIFDLLQPLGYSYLQLLPEGRLRAGKLTDRDVDFHSGNFFFVPDERASEFRAFLP